jgi:hypothetical protein
MADAVNSAEITYIETVQFEPTELKELQELQNLDKFPIDPDHEITGTGRLRSLSKGSLSETEPLTGIVCLQYAYKFPWLTDSELIEYKIYTRSCFDLVAIGPITFFITVFYASHANFQYALSDGPFFTAGLVFGILASVLFYIVFIFAHGVRSYSKDSTETRFIQGLSTLIFNSIYLEDVIAVLATMSASSYLYARVSKGQCQLNTTLWVWSSDYLIFCIFLPDFRSLSEAEVICIHPSRYFFDHYHFIFIVLIID